MEILTDKTIKNKAKMFSALIHVLKAWRAEVCARYIAKHPEETPQDCCLGWEQIDEKHISYIDSNSVLTLDS